MRINTPQRNQIKLEQVILYLLREVGGFANFNLSLIKYLLYFIDIDHYELHEVQMMGLKYKKSSLGLEVSDLDSVIAKMQASEKIEAVEFVDKVKLLPLVNPDLSLLDGAELQTIKSVISRYAQKSLDELIGFVDLDCPYKVAKIGDSLEYEHAFYRHDMFSVREYEAL